MTPCPARRLRPAATAKPPTADIDGRLLRTTERRLKSPANRAARTDHPDRIPAVSQPAERAPDREPSGALDIGGSRRRNVTSIGQLLAPTVGRRNGPRQTFSDLSCHKRADATCSTTSTGPP